MAREDTLLKIAENLDRKAIALPYSLTIADDSHAITLHGAKGTNSYSEIVKTILAKRFSADCIRAVLSCFREIDQCQNTNAWNAFAANKGELRIEDTKQSRDEETSMMTCELSHILFDKQAKKPVDTYEMECVLRYNKQEDFEDSLHHELGHFFDDSHYSFKGENGKIATPVKNFHCNNELWKKLVMLDDSLYPYSESAIINSESRVIAETLEEEHNYSPDKSDWDKNRPNEWPEEFFTQAVARHFGPPPEYKLRSPLFKLYMDKIVDLDARIMTQHKSMEEKQIDREKLLGALHRPLSHYFDADRLDKLFVNWEKLMKQLKNSASETKEPLPYLEQEELFNERQYSSAVRKKFIIGEIEKCIAQGMDKLSHEVSKTIGLSHTDGLTSSDQGKTRF